MDPAEFAKLTAGRTERTDHFSIQRKFVNPARESVAAIQILRASLRNADGPRRAILPSGGIAGDRISEPGLGVRRDRYVNRDFALDGAFRIEHLNPAIPTIRDIDVALRVGRDAVRRIELARLRAAIAPLL